MAWALTLAVLLLGCRDDVLSANSSTLRFEPQEVSFGSLYADEETHLALASVINEGRSSVEVTWSGPGAPFFVDLPTLLPPGETTLTLRLEASVAALYSRTLKVRASEGQEVELLLTARVHEIPVCTPSGDCLTSTFDRAQGACVESPVTNGTACQVDSRCLIGAACQQGRCIGTAVTCDDGDVCTIDVCREEVGCEFLPRPPCPGDGACQRGVCDSREGCGLAPMEDGTSCGSLRACNAAEVCISGACVVRDPPDGYLCLEASPCQGEGRCLADVCVTPSPVKTTLGSSWRYDSLATGDVDAGIPPEQYHDFVMEPSGAITLGGFFRSPPLLRANTAGVLVAPEGAARRCVVWNGRVVCADYPASPNGRVTAINPATGATEWSYDVRTSRPDFTAQTTQIFMARLVVQSSDRLAALYESYPRATTGANTALCRSYYLVVMNAQGREVQARPISDPLLDVCNHPHPYGVASDSLGNLYIAFSPSVSDHAPLVPDRPTLLVSYNRDGLFRWKVTDFTMKGGELAVARGLLYPENGEVVVEAATGRAAFALPGALGRTVVSDARFLPAPVVGGTALSGYEAGTPTQRWTHLLPTGMQFWSEQFRLASWQTSRGPRTVALTFVQDTTSGLLPVRSLRAIDVATGAEGFTCPVVFPPVRTPPQLFEVGPGTLSVMSGALDVNGAPGCSKCDPPFANSSAAFATFPLPGLSIAKEPWVGTFGGEGHDHHEDVVPIAPGM